MRRRYEKGQLIWVAPGSVRYDREDIDFLLPWLKEMREGVGPAEPESGYVGGRHSGIKDRAHYEAWCEVASVIGERLKKTKFDRFLVERYIELLDELAPLAPDTAYDTIVARIADEVDTESKKIHRGIQSAISYISSGKCSRWLNCIDCYEYERCARKEYPPNKFNNPIGISYTGWKSKRTREHHEAKIQQMRKKT